ncbi:glycine receptor subunit alpha-2-like [Centruroides vittatus]|uniref:glycine receptor subunit alpha-2-like n=1 Tax=Centruroides vittatus TaxID=120091 RepID=UPI0035104EBD
MLSSLLTLLSVICYSYAFQCSGDRCKGLKLGDIVPEGYDKFSPPIENGKPTEVEVFISVLNIRSIRETTMSYHADIFLHQYWKDNRLEYPENATYKILLDEAWAKQIWKPDILFKNSLEGKVQNIIVPYTYVNFYPDKRIFFASRLSLQLSCEMDLHKFPHDFQTCDISIMGLTHQADEMVLNWKDGCGLQITDNVLLPQFDVVNSSCGRCEKSYQIGTFSCITGFIRLRRRTGYYTINVYVPSILIVGMSMLTFWIPPEAVPARVTLGVTSLLTIVTKQYQASLPSVSYIVAMNVWMSSCIAFVFCSLLEYALVVSLKKKRDKRAKLEANLSPLTTTEKVASRDPEWKSRINRYFKDVDPDRVSRILFPVAFLFQIAAYFLRYGL